MLFIDLLLFSLYIAQYYKQNFHNLATCGEKVKYLTYIRDLS